MTDTAETAKIAKTTRERLAEVTLLRDDVLEDVNDQTSLFHAHKRSGSYRSREEAHRSKQWLDLLKLREKMYQVTDELLELREKLKKEEEDGEKAPGGN